MAEHNLEELWSRLKNLRSEELRNLSPEGLARVLGTDPRELPLTTRMELAKRIYGEYGLPQRWIASRLRMSLRDLSKALRYEEGSAQTPSSTSSVLGDPEIVAKAIKLIREGRARNLNDLVLELRIPLDHAGKLFERIVKNEGLTNVKTIDAVAKISRYVREVERRFQRIEEISRELNELIERAESTGKELEKKTRLITEGLKFLRELRAVPALAEALRDYLEWLRDRVWTRVGDEKTRCVWIDKQGYCTKWSWHEKYEGWDMRLEVIVTKEGKKTVYRMNVLKHSLLCPFCPYYSPGTQRI